MNRNILKCRSCGNVWKYTGVKTIAICPLCGKPKDARDRRGYSQAYLTAHPERKDKLKNWLKENKKSHSDTTSIRLKKSVFALISKSTEPHCVRCGCDDLRLLEINHKNGGGGKEYKQGKNAMAIYRDIAMLRRSTDDLELLCRVCNALHYLESKYGRLPMVVLWKK